MWLPSENASREPQYVAPLVIPLGGKTKMGVQREGYGGHILTKHPKMALISEYLAAESSPDTLQTHWQ